MYEEDYEDEDWYIEGPRGGDFNYVDFAPDELTFTPMPWRNLLGHVAEWRAELADWQLSLLAGIADEDGWGLKIEWGCFMCPAHWSGKTLVVNTEGVW